MEKLKLFRGNFALKIFILGITFMSLFFVFDTWEVSFNQYKSLENEFKNRTQDLNELKSEIEFLSQKIEDLDDPEKVDIILREYGYGKPGETIDIFEVPEPLTPIEETLQSERSKSFIQYFVEFIVGTNGE
ncbi:MAG: septum formation initiator family protein [Candidatus Actinomarina sp.]|jgi:cell division protein FtsB|tara:strand:- start:162 stop:554 length:393 start_codon:yes stop_codon:yes gene_type:complete